MNENKIDANTTEPGRRVMQKIDASSTPSSALPDITARESGQAQDMAEITEPVKTECKRCGRLFTPTKPDQEYGEKCLKKMAGQTVLLDRYVVPPRKKRQRK